MARNNFTPIATGSAATSNSINAPLEQLSDAIDVNKGNITALEEEISSGVKLPIYCVCESASGIASKICQVDLNSCAAKDSVSKGDLFLVCFQNTFSLSASEIRIQYDGTTIKRATAKGIPSDVTAGSIILLYFDGTYFNFVGYACNTSYINQ